ncbi:MAG: hypothetical protein J6M06_04235 [Synergistaceae bacterium]|nr:hypothetical protein [Synergistaceae bacterium]
MRNKRNDELHNAKRAILQTAFRFGKPVSVVRREIEAAIDEAMHSTDPEVMERWKHIPFEGEKPTPEEFIAYAAKEVAGKQ